MSSNYEIAETESFRKLLRKNKSLAGVYRRMVDVVYPMLRRKPHFGPNIKRLKGEFDQFYRYQGGDYRLFYSIEENKVVVVIVDLRTRQEAHLK